MTKETYSKHHETEHVGKHEKKYYNVWRVLSPVGPEVTETVYGLDAAHKAILGCWDWEVTDMDGNIVPDRKVNNNK